MGWSLRLHCFLMQELKALCDAAGYVSKGASQAALNRIRSVTYPCSHSSKGSQEQ